MNKITLELQKVIDVLSHKSNSGDKYSNMSYNVYLMHVCIGNSVSWSQIIEFEETNQRVDHRSSVGVANLDEWVEEIDEDPGD